MNNTQKLDLILIKLEKLDLLENKFNHLETRFDTLETRFDSLETRFDTLDNKVNKIENKVNSLSIDMKSLYEYKNRNNKIIELEVKESIFNILQQKEKSLLFFDVTKIFPKKLKNKTGQDFVELDGLIIGTDDREFASKYDQKFNLINKNITKKLPSNTNNKGYKYNFYIIEAKHNITKKKLESKYNQYLRLKEYFKNLENNFTQYNSHYQNIIKKFNLTLFNENSIYLIIGGPYWQEDALNYYTKNLKNNDHIYKIEINDERYKTDF